MTFSLHLDRIIPILRRGSDYLKEQVTETVKADADFFVREARAVTEFSPTGTLRALLAPKSLSTLPMEKASGPIAALGTGDADAFDPNDITQGGLGDCWFLAGAAAVARANPDAIRRLIKDNEDGTYDVTLYYAEGLGPKRPHVFRVDDTFPKKYERPGDDGELWPMLLEKALAQKNGRYEGHVLGIEGGLPGAGIDYLTPGDVSTHLTALRSQDTMLREMAKALKENAPVAALTSQAILASTERAATLQGIVTSHVYAVKSVDLEKRTVSLQNPWGKDDLNDLPIATFNRFFNMYAIGEPLTKE
jgi:hypothetical protein